MRNFKMLARGGLMMLILLAFSTALSAQLVDYTKSVPEISVKKDVPATLFYDPAPVMIQKATYAAYATTENAFELYRSAQEVEMERLRLVLTLQRNSVLLSRADRWWYASNRAYLLQKSYTTPANSRRLYRTSLE